MKMFVGLVLFVAFALPAAAFAAHQDVITLKAYEELLKNGVAHEMTKTVISNPVLEEALESYSKKKLGGLPTCGETCTLGTCYTPGCTCSWPLCTKNSLETQDVITLQAYQELLKNGAAREMTKTVISNPVLEEALVSYSKERLGGAMVCGETCWHGVCNTPRCTCTPFKICGINSLESTKSTNPIGEALAKKGLGGFPL